MRNIFKISLRVNNQISITRYSTASKKENRYESLGIPSLSYDEIERLKVRLWESNGDDTFWNPVTRRASRVAKQIRPLDLICRFQQVDCEFGDPRNPKKQHIKRGYGRTPLIRNFGAIGGQKLRECGGAMDILHGGDPSKCRVVTLTLPASGEDAFRALSDYSGYASNRLFQIIRRKKDDSIHWFYCIEHQKRGALHWHICLFHQDKQISERLGDEMVREWRDILRDIGLRSGLDLLYSRGFGRQVAASEMQSINQEMRKGCGAYFAKYAAKTHKRAKGGEPETIDSRNARLYPCSSYWGRSRNLKKLCDTYSLKFKYEGMNDDDSESLRSEAFEILSQSTIVLSHSFSFKKEITIRDRKEMRTEQNGTLTICEGETEVFYVSPTEYQKLLLQFGQLYAGRDSCAIKERARKRVCSELTDF